MAYGKHYIIQAVGKNSQFYNLEVWEEDYDGQPEQIPAGSTPFIQSLIGQSDDPFAAILASSLQVNADISTYLGTLPDFTTNDDRKYYVKLSSHFQPASGNVSILWQNSENRPLVLADSNLAIFVNGVQVLEQFTNGTGQLALKAGDVVQADLQVFILPAPAGTEWELIVQKNGVTVYDVTLTTVVIGSNQSYTFAAEDQAVYSILAKVKNMADPGPNPPVNTEYLLWQGFILNDNVQLPFASGYRGLNFVCTDGLAMLKNIPYVPTDADINVPESLLQIVLNCLNRIELPFVWFLNICVSVYANGMQDRGDGSQYEPFSQAYYPPRNWLNSPAIPVQGVVSTSDFKSCYDVLTSILSAFGCQIKMSEGEYVIASINEQAEGSIYFTKYDLDGILIDSGTKNISRTIVPWTPDAELYFVDASQLKILRKGFPDVQLKCAAAYAPQCIDNGNMQDISGGFPRKWGGSFSVGSVALTSLGPFNAISITPTGGGPTQRTPYAFPLSSAPGYAGDQINLQFWIDGQATPSSTKPKCYLQVLLQDAALNVYWLDSSGNWQLQVGPPPTPDTRYYNVIGNTSAAYENISITTPPMPVSGTLFFRWVTDNFDTFACTIANVNMTFTSPYQYRLNRNNITNPSYQKVIEVSIGGQCDALNYNQVGSLLDSSGAILFGWYRYGVTETYETLMQLVYKQIFNVISKASLNFDADFRRLFSTVDSVTTPTAPFIAIQVQDTSGQLSADGKTYLPGYATINHTQDTFQATLLETSNTDLPYTPINLAVPKNQA